jgi:hypothetical protein
MRKLYYSSGSMLVADITCKAVLRYARALADVGKSDIVTVPVVTEGGSNASAHLLIGPASQLWSIPVENSHGDEPIDESAIAEIERETQRMQPTRPSWDDEMIDIVDVDYLTFPETA